jgi:two-component sensor histidine kinase
MVGDRRRISIRVQATRGAATSTEAVSFGLIVTELVINAKHAFPSGGTGDVLVSYDDQAPEWSLSVSDNGSGPQEASNESPHTGLGTSIVDALAQQLKATVQKTGGPQGTTISITGSNDFRNG